jgi:hypothetical protein
MEISQQIILWLTLVTVISYSAVSFYIEKVIVDPLPNQKLIAIRYLLEISSKLLSMLFILSLFI